MVERGEGLARAPRILTPSDQAQLLRRRRYGINEQGLPAGHIDALLRWQRPRASARRPDIQHDFRVLASLLTLLGVPEHLPTNAAAPPRRKP